MFKYRFEWIYCFFLQITNTLLLTQKQALGKEWTYHNPTPLKTANPVKRTLHWLAIRKFSQWQKHSLTCLAIPTRYSQIKSGQWRRKRLLTSLSKLNNKGMRQLLRKCDSWILWSGNCAWVESEQTKFVTMPKTIDIPKTAVLLHTPNERAGHD